MLKKKHIITLAGERLTVKVARTPSGPQVQFEDGDLLSVDQRAVLAGKARSVQINGALHLVHLSAVGEHGQFQATINGRPVSLTALNELAALNQESQANAVGDGTLTADIPGLVVNVVVSEGQQVEAGAPLVVIEAMKMQNELSADLAGVVTKIAVKTGQSVYPGDVLVVITPEEQA